MQINKENLSSEKLGMLLREIFISRGITQKQIELDIGIRQGQISHIFNGHFKKNSSRNVQALCKHANVQINKKKKKKNKVIRNKVLVDAINNVWDGTFEDACALAEVIKSLRFVRNNL